MEKKSITSLAIIGMIAMFFIGWGVTSLLTPVGGEQRATFVITGSTTTEPLITECADQFMAINPNVDISVSGTGSGSGISDTINGLNDIGMSSRNIKTTENDTAGGTLIDYKFAKDGIAVIISVTHPNATWLQINGLTMDQVFLIYNGTYNTWDDINPSLVAQSIDVYTRPDGSGTRGSFEELVTKDSEELGDNSGYQTSVTGYLEVASNTVMAQQVGLNSYGFGYCGLGFVDANLIAVPVNGVVPSVATILDETYAISRSLHMLTNGPATGWVQAFIDFVYGPYGQKVVEDEGFIRIWF